MGTEASGCTVLGLSFYLSLLSICFVLFFFFFLGGGGGGKLLTLILGGSGAGG